MLVRILQLSFLPFLICLGSKLNQSYQYRFQEDAVLDVLNPSDGQTVTTQQLKTILTALQKNYVSQISKLQNDFEVTLRYHENRIQSLEKKSAEKDRIISTLQDDFAAACSIQETSESNVHEKEEGLKSKDEPTAEDSVNDALPNFKKRYFHSLKSKRNMERGRKEAPGVVVAFYAYMSSTLPRDVATPHHVLIFDHVRTNIGNGYHPSTGVFIAPETGVYVFMWNFLNGDSGNHSTQLMINSEEWGIAHSHTAAGTWAQSTGFVVAHVNKGDDVFVKTSSTSSGFIDSNNYGKTSFSGWKID